MQGTAIAQYCLESQRVFILSYATSPKVLDPDLTVRLQAYLNAFGYHGIDWPIVFARWD